MDAELVAPATPPTEPIQQTTETPAPELSIAEHEAQFGQQNATTDESPAEKPRHRAKSQQAGPADVPRIAELTKKLREAERERDEWKSKHSAAPVAREPERPAAMPADPDRAPAPTDKPIWKAFEEQIGTKYDTWGEAQDAFADARDDWKTGQAQKAQQAQAAQQTHQATIDTYVTRARDFSKTQPDFFEKTAAAAPQFDTAPQLLTTAVILHDNGPQIAYYLATHPDVLDELSLLTDGKPVNQQTVAILQRRLNSYRSLAAPTASAPAVSPRPTAPRPPNAVRTGPLKPTDDPPGDDASIAEHERYYGKRRR